MSLLYRSGDQGWVPVGSTSYENEEELRRLLVADPGILPLDELPSVESKIRITVGREAALGSGFADAIWVDLEGNLTILEVKLRANPEIRREVLAQALSYAAFLEGMSTETFFDRIARPYLRSSLGDRVAELPLDRAVAEISGADVDEAVFWEGLERSLSRGRFTILVVVDEPHSQLRRSVSYVNSHADFELYLVEVGYYRSPDGEHQVLAPRILDAAARPPSGAKSAQRSEWTLDAFLEQSADRYPENHESMRRLVFGLQELEQGGKVDLGFGSGKQASLIVRAPDGVTSWLWVKSSGSVQMPRYKLRDFGYSDPDITDMMRRVAEVSDAPPGKYSTQDEPQIVSGAAFSRAGVVDRILEVVGSLTEDYRLRPDQGGEQ